MRTLLLVVLMYAFTVKAQLIFDDYFLPKTLRVDYYHSGNYINEYYVLEKNVEEPYWGGNRVNLVDVFDFGDHRFFVKDSATGTLIYSRGFSSLFAEWRMGEEARNQCGNFAETVVMPFPKKTILLEFHTRDSLNTWQGIASFYINPQTDMVSNPNFNSYNVVQIHHSGNPSEKLDIAFLAEGYTAADMDKFINDCNRLARSLLLTEPFKKNRKKINIWAVKSVSEDAGVSNPLSGTTKNTVMGASFNTFDMDRYLMSLEHFAIRDVAANVPYDQIYVLVNTNEYGGGGIYNFFSIGTASHPYADFLLWHELGHALGGLADEYESDDDIFQNMYPPNVEPWEPNITTLAAFENKWQDMLKAETPIPTPENIRGNPIGAFEGAGYTSRGVYRPMKNCIMRSGSTRSFCGVCEKSLSDKIIFYTR